MIKGKVNNLKPMLHVPKAVCLVLQMTNVNEVTCKHVLVASICQKQKSELKRQVR